MYKLIPFSALSLVLSACSLTSSQQPQLLQNEKFNATSEAQRTADRIECMASADKNVERDGPAEYIATRAVLGAAVGSATGAVSGVIFGETAESVASGAAVGGLVATLQSLFDLQSHPESYERFVEHCLQKKGYEITGWKDPPSEADRVISVPAPAVIEDGPAPDLRVIPAPPRD